MVKHTPFGMEVRAHLTSSNIPQQLLAKELGVTSAYISTLMVGRRNPSPAWVDRIANALSLTPEERQILHILAAQQKGFKL